MRVVVFCNNWVGWQVLRFLINEGETIVAVVIHPEERSRYRNEILQECQRLQNVLIFEGTQLRSEDIKKTLRYLQPDVGVSAYFGYIISPAFLDIFPRGIVNLHPSLLPYNRGAYPNVWSIVDETPAGVTLHYIDEGIDTGDILAQVEEEVRPSDTGETLYHRLEQAAVSLFCESWPRFKLGQLKPIPQSPDAGTHHRRADVETIDRIDLDKKYKARDLINILRARTFTSYRGAYFEVGNKRIYIRVVLEEDEYDED